MRCLRVTAIATVLVAIFLPVQPGNSAETGRDEIGNAWKARAAKAAKNLAGSGLDACDMAFERAFERPKEGTSGSLRVFELTFDIRGKKMVATYSYDSGRLDAFGIVMLPQRWMAVQRANSKTLNILVADEHCAFDLCTRDPFSIGPCRGEPQ